MRGKYVLAAVAAGVLLGSCASVWRGTKETYNLTTEPPGALATFSTGLTCTTPCSPKMKHKRPFTVTLEKEGYQTVEMVVDSRVSKTTAGNAAIGGGIGLGVDAITGAMKKLVPNPAHVVLEPGAGSYRVASRKGTEQIEKVPEGMNIEDFFKSGD